MSGDCEVTENRAAVAIDTEPDSVEGSIAASR